MLADHIDDAPAAIPLLDVRERERRHFRPSQPAAEEIRSTILSEDAVVDVNNVGFFEVNLKPRQGQRFKDNMVCAITLNPNAVRQKPSVLKIIGTKGELLGIGNNPQLGKMSGENYYLETLVHIP